MIVSKITQQSTRKTLFFSNNLPIASFSTVATRRSSSSPLSNFDNGILYKKTMNDTILLSPSKKNVFFDNRRYKSIQPSSSFQNEVEEEELVGLKKGINNIQEEQEGDIPTDNSSSRGVHDIVNFPSSNKEMNDTNSSTTPVLLNSKQHAVGYLNRILNARVYEAAIETQLQHAKSLSMVRDDLLFLVCVFFFRGWSVLKQKK